MRRRARPDRHKGMTKQKRPVKTPATIKTDRDLYAMPRTSVTVGDYWMLLQEGTPSGFELVLVKQKTGDEATNVIHIPRKVFAKFVRWFETGRVR